MNYSRNLLLSAFAILAMHTPTALSGELRDYSLPSARYETMQYRENSDARAQNLMNQPQTFESNFSADQLEYIHQLEVAKSTFKIEDLNELLLKYNKRIEQASDQEQVPQIRFFSRLKRIVKEEIEYRKTLDQKETAK